MKKNNASAAKKTNKRTTRSNVIAFRPEARPCSGPTIERYRQAIRSADRVLDRKDRAGVAKALADLRTAERNLLCNVVDGAYAGQTGSALNPVESLSIALQLGNFASHARFCLNELLNAKSDKLADVIDLAAIRAARSKVSA